jgi:hypothetical protein
MGVGQMKMDLTRFTLPVKNFIKKPLVAAGIGFMVSVPAENAYESTMALMFPDLFDMSVQEVVDIQQVQFDALENSIQQLSKLTVGNAEAQTVISQLSQNLNQAMQANQTLTSKLETVAYDREVLRNELLNKKGGDLIPTISLPEFQTIYYPDLGVLALRDYYAAGKSIIFTINDQTRRLYVGDSIKIEQGNQLCRLVYRGMHDGKHGVEKICNKA